jgi:hypothetical protein
MQWIKGLVAHWVQPEFWLNLQKIYGLRLAEDKAWDMIKELPTLGQASKKRGGDSRPEPR